MYIRDEEVAELVIMLYTRLPNYGGRYLVGEVLWDIGLFPSLLSYKVISFRADKSSRVFLRDEDIHKILDHLIHKVSRNELLGGGRIRGFRSMHEDLEWETVAVYPVDKGGAK